MSELKDIDDLRPAPCSTPMRVLWAMLAVVVGCVGLLIWAPPSATGVEMATASALHEWSGPARAEIERGTSAEDPAPVTSQAP